jgi:hypothetical protein
MYRHIVDAFGGFHDVFAVLAYWPLHLCITACTKLPYRSVRNIFQQQYPDLGFGV